MERVHARSLSALPWTGQTICSRLSNILYKQASQIKENAMKITTNPYIGKIDEVTVNIFISNSPHGVAAFLFVSKFTQ
jgi:hypothetical protein